MPKGLARDWTLDELRLVWEFDGDDGTTVREHASNLNISHSTWYSMRARLQGAGGPEELFARMERDRVHRYNRAANGKARMGTKTTETLGQALARVYTMRVSQSGRDGSQPQYTVTIPPTLAAPFVDRYGALVMYEPHPDGILLKPVPEAPEPELPEWLAEADAALTQATAPLSPPRTSSPVVPSEGGPRQ